MQCALDLKRASSAPFATKKVSLEGVISVLRLLEVPLGDVTVSAEQDLSWPETVGDQTTPPVDGALVLYDVMNQDSLTRIPNVLSEYFIFNHCGPVRKGSQHCNFALQCRVFEAYAIEEADMKPNP